MVKLQRNREKGGMRVKTQAGNVDSQEEEEKEDEEEDEGT